MLLTDASFCGADASRLHRTGTDKLTSLGCGGRRASRYTTAYWSQLVTLATDPATTAETKLICPR